jgi:hypothetical protein
MFWFSKDTLNNIGWTRKKVGGNIMENAKDKKEILNQLNELLYINSKLKENFSALQLLTFDSNNSRLKDISFSQELDYLNNSIDCISRSIEIIKDKVKPLN